MISLNYKPVSAAKRKGAPPDILHIERKCTWDPPAQIRWSKCGGAAMAYAVSCLLDNARIQAAFPLGAGLTVIADMTWQQAQAVGSWWKSDVGVTMAALEKVYRRHGLIHHVEKQGSVPLIMDLLLQDEPVVLLLPWDEREAYTQFDFPLFGTYPALYRSPALEDSKGSHFVVAVGHVYHARHGMLIVCQNWYGDKTGYRGTFHVRAPHLGHLLAEQRAFAWSIVL